MIFREQIFFAIESAYHGPASAKHLGWFLRCLPVGWLCSTEQGMYIELAGVHGWLFQGFIEALLWDRASKRPSNSCSSRVRGFRLPVSELVFFITHCSEFFRAGGDAHSSERRAPGSQGSHPELLSLPEENDSWGQDTTKPPQAGCPAPGNGKMVFDLACRVSGVLRDDQRHLLFLNQSFSVKPLDFSIAEFCKNWSWGFILGLLLGRMFWGGFFLSPSIVWRQ